MGREEVGERSMRPFTRRRWCHLDSFPGAVSHSGVGETEPSWVKVMRRTQCDRHGSQPWHNIGRWDITSTLQMMKPKPEISISFCCCFLFSSFLSFLFFFPQAFAL